MKKIKKYQSPSGSFPVWQAPVGEDWQKEWKYRLTPASRSKVAGGWSSKGKVKRASESGEQYTKRRIKEETKRTWRSDAADIAHGIGEGALALHPYTAIPYYGAKVGQDFLNGNLNWGTALNASIPLFHLSPQAVGLREATNVALEDAANAGSKTARNWRVAREINEGIKQNTKNGKIEVTENYFNSPDKWYRVTETPEKFGIQEQGKNITTRDNPNIKGTIGSWRTSIIKNYTAENGSHFKIMPGKENNEGYFIKTPDKYRFSLSKQGAAHGNTSQAAKGRIWGGTFAYSDKFPRGILEGQAPTKIFRGMTETGKDSRTNFILQDWDNVPHGARVGFHTGEMPMSNLGWFQRTKNGTYTYEPIIPEKRITYEPIKALEPSTSLKFFERKPSRISQAEIEGIPKGERNQPFKAKVPKITAENAASITPEQWTAAQDAAIARGDMAETQRLRDLHFKVKSPKANIPDQYHGTHYDNLGNQIILNKGLEQGTNGVGFYTSSNKPYARKYGPNIFRFKVNARKEDLAPGRFAYLSETRMNDLKAQGYEGTIDTTSGPMLGAGKDATEYTFFNPNSYKLADAITYDNNGVRIPLGKRDNFNIKDIRYGLLPFGIGLTGYGLYKRKQGGKMNTLQFLKNGSGIHIKKKNRGKFTDYCGGQVTQECINKGKHSSNPAIRKRATFADNARKWKHKNGGKAFVEGVNVLDSNPKAYKYVKKKYKMRMAQDGTKFDWNSLANIGANLLQSGISTYVQNKRITNQGNADKQNYKSEMLPLLQEGIKNERAKRQNILNSIKSTADNPNAFGGVFEDVFIRQGDNDAINEYNQKVKNNDLAIDRQVQAQKSENTGNFISGMMQQGAGILSSLGNKSSNTTTGITTPSITTSSYNYFSAPKKFGTFNNDGSMNLGYNMTWSTDKGVQTKNWSDGIFNKSITDYLK